MTDPTPYEKARDEARLHIRNAMNVTRYDGRGNPIPVHVADSTAIASAILALAEAIRPQPDVVNVTVTDAVVTKITATTTGDAR